MTITDSILSSVAVKVFNDFDRAGIKYGNIITIVVNNRLSACWGRCIRKRNYNKEYFIIEIAPNTMSNIDSIRQTLAHEIVHTVEGCFNHGDCFNYIGKRLSMFSDFPYDIKRTSSVQEHGMSIEDCYKYILECPDCNRKWGRNRMCKVIKYGADCPYCGIMLNRVK